MPFKTKHYCKVPGCNLLVNAGESFCIKHRRAQEDNRQSPSKRGYGRRWKKVRESFLIENPYCSECQKQGRLIRADEVHHIIAIIDGGDNNEDNLLSLCHSCHSKITAKENGGFGKEPRPTYENLPM